MVAAHAEQALRPSEARTHGAGMLLAESLIGINHTLHSRAAAVVPLMLQEDILSVGDLKVSLEGCIALHLPCMMHDDEHLQMPLCLLTDASHLNVDVWSRRIPS